MRKLKTPTNTTEEQSAASLDSHALPQAFLDGMEALMSGHKKMAARRGILAGVRFALEHNRDITEEELKVLLGEVL